MTKKYKNKKTGEIYEVLDAPIDKNGGDQDGLFQVLYRRVEQDQTYVRTPQDFHDHFEELVVEPWHPEYLEKVLFTWGKTNSCNAKWSPVTYVSKVQVKDILFAFIVDEEGEPLTIRFDQIKQMPAEPPIDSTVQFLKPDGCPLLKFENGYLVWDHIKEEDREEEITAYKRWAETGLYKWHKEKHINNTKWEDSDESVNNTAE